MSPFRIDPYEFPNRTKIAFTTSARMPHDIYAACLATGIVSNTVYCQRAVVDALVRDLGLDRNELLAELPEPRGPAKHVGYRRPYIPQIGPAGTDENVK